MSAGEPTKILFGTDGWRAKIGDEFTFENVRRLAEGVARVVEQDGTTAKGVVVAYDRRFGSEDFAVAAAEMLLAHGIPVAYAATAVPTQMASYEVVARGAAMGVVITASHNPWMDNGFKVKAPSGAAAGPELLKRIETEVATTRGPELSGRPFADAEAAGLVERYDPYPGYKKFVERNLDLAHLAAQPLSIMVDPVYGAGAGWIGRLLAGGTLRVTEMRSERNPWFGGVNPEPIRPHIDPVLDAMRGGGYDLGLLLDGDADRAGAVTEKGAFIHQLQAFGLLAYYMLEHKKDLRPIVKTVNESSMGERLGAHYGAKVFETPVGFKYVGPKMIETGASMGGEESGGYGFAMHLPERDGIFADLLPPRPSRPRARPRPEEHERGARARAVDRRRVALPARRRAHSTRRIPRGEGAARDPACGRAAEHARRTPCARRPALHRRRREVLHLGRELAAGALQRHRAAGSRLRRSDERCAARRTARDRRAARARLIAARART